MKSMQLPLYLYAHKKHIKIEKTQRPGLNTHTNDKDDSLITKIGLS